MNFINLKTTIKLQNVTVIAKKFQMNYLEISILSIKIYIFLHICYHIIIL
jgi:hypothetical protein